MKTTGPMKGLSEPVELFTRCTFGPEGKHDFTTLGTTCFHCGKFRDACCRFEPSRKDPP